MIKCSGNLLKIRRVGQTEHTLFIGSCTIILIYCSSLLLTFIQQIHVCALHDNPMGKLIVQVLLEICEEL